jgi:hypothetical protein
MTGVFFPLSVSCASAILIPPTICSRFIIPNNSRKAYPIFLKFPYFFLTQSGNCITNPL